VPDNLEVRAHEAYAATLRMAQESAISMEDSTYLLHRWNEQMRLTLALLSGSIALLERSRHLLRSGAPPTKDETRG
jgi:hypothetical protein